MSQTSELLHQLVTSANGRALPITQNDFSVICCNNYHIFALLVDSILGVRLKYKWFRYADGSFKSRRFFIWIRKHALHYNILHTCVSLPERCTDLYFWSELLRRDLFFFNCVGDRINCWRNCYIPSCFSRLSVTGFYFCFPMFWLDSRRDSFLYGASFFFYFLYAF